MSYKYTIEFIRHLEEKFDLNIDKELKEYIEINGSTYNLSLIQEEMDAKIKEACYILKIKYIDVLGKSRSHENVVLRNVLISHFYNRYPVSLKTIGRVFGGRDHSTVIHARQQVENYKDTKYELYTYYANELQTILK